MGFREIFKAEDQTERDSQCVPVIDELLCQFKPVSRYNTAWRIATENVKFETIVPTESFLFQAEVQLSFHQ